MPCMCCIGVSGRVASPLTISIFDATSLRRSATFSGCRQGRVLFPVADQTTNQVVAHRVKCPGYENHRTLQDSSARLTSWSVAITSTQQRFCTIIIVQ